MSEIRKFYLSPGQQAPEGSTSIGMPDGGIIWEGEIWTSKDITNHILSQSEMDEYQKYLKYIQTETEFNITFDEFKNENTLQTKKQNIINKINNINNIIEKVN